MYVHRDPDTLDWHATWSDGDVEFPTRREAVRFAYDNARSNPVA